MTPAIQLWLCAGTVYLFATSNRSHLREEDGFWLGFIIECLWAFVLVAPAFTGAVLAVREIFK